MSILICCCLLYTSASEAHIYGWVDFNQNGKFDEYERSNLATITQDGTVELTFANSKTYIDPSVNELGARVRIAKKANEIENPTGMAFSGEVEDFKTQITHPPKGEFKETSGLQGAKQTATVAFTARGEHKYQRNSQAVSYTHLDVYKRQLMDLLWKKVKWRLDKTRSLPT